MVIRLDGTVRPLYRIGDISRVSSRMNYTRCTCGWKKAIYADRWWTGRRCCSAESMVLTKELQMFPVEVRLYEVDVKIRSFPLRYRL